MDVATVRCSWQAGKFEIRIQAITTRPYMCSTGCSGSVDIPKEIERRMGVLSPSQKKERGLPEAAIVGAVKNPDAPQSIIWIRIGFQRTSGASWQQPSKVRCEPGGGVGSGDAGSTKAKERYNICEGALPVNVAIVGSAGIGSSGQAVQNPDGYAV